MQTYFNAFRWMATTKPCIVSSIPMFSFLYKEIPYSTIHFASNLFKTLSGPSWPWSYGSWIYNYLCNQCLSPLMLWIQILLRRCDLPQVGGFIRVLQFPPVSSTKKNRPPRYNLNIVESDVKHHQTNKQHQDAVSFQIVIRLKLHFF